MIVSKTLAFCFNHGVCFDESHTSIYLIYKSKSSEVKFWFERKDKKEYVIIIRRFALPFRNRFYLQIRYKGNPTGVRSMKQERRPF